MKHLSTTPYGTPITNFHNSTTMIKLFLLIATLCAPVFAQEPPTPETQTIIVNAAQPKPPAFLYAATARAQASVGMKEIEQTIDLELRIVQGQGETVSLGLGGTGDVIEVKGDSIIGWAVRTTDAQRYLDLQLKPVANKKDEDNVSNIKATIRLRSQHSKLPAKVELGHLKPGKALGFDSQLQIDYSAGVVGKVVAADGFASLTSTKSRERLQTATGGRLELQLDRSSALPPDVELLGSTLHGRVDSNGKSIGFEFRSTATVNAANSRLRVLSGNVAITQLPTSSDYELQLVTTENGPAYELIFAKTGSFPVAIDFVAAIKTDAANWQSLDFAVGVNAVGAIEIEGMDTSLEFASDPQTITPRLVDKTWRGNLPATGRVDVRWQSARSTTETKSFFTTSSTIDATVGPGLLRQDHRINYQLLQGQLKSLSIKLVGPGEILSVEGDKIIAWKVVGEGNERQLDITLNQPLSANSQVTIRSQTALGDFPVRTAGLSLQPQGAIRSSGHLRITNSGSVSVEPTDLRGLTQLAPEQFPAEPIQARQLFVYRYPATDYGFTIVADRIKPEVSVTQVVLYQLSESDRVILADVELDVREAAIRDWNLQVPEDYSIVSVTGASVADYMASSEVSDGQRNLKVLFSQDVIGRQLVSLRLEKNEAATSGPWILPHVNFPDAEAVRGDIGIVTAPGYRASVGTIELLVEKPLSYFPKPVPNLQQAFRIRETGWKATMQIEQLERSVQADAFHLISLSQGTVYGSALINYTVTGAPVSEWQLTVPASLGNVTVDGQSIRTWRRDGDTLIVSLQQPILGTYTLLVTYEDKPNAADGSFQAGQVAPLGVQGDRGFIEVVSPVQVEMESLLVSNQLLVLDSLELPAELRLLSTAPALGTWQYTQRPFDLRLKVKWFDPGTTAGQVVEFSEANSRVSQDGELVTDLLYYVKSRGQRTLKLRLPGDPVRLWAVSVNGRPVTARQAGDDTLIPLPGGTDPNEPIEVSLRLGKPSQNKGHASVELPTVFAPVLKTQWNLQAAENHVLIPTGGTVEPTMPAQWPSGFDWLANGGLVPLGMLVLLTLAALVVPVALPIRTTSLALAVCVAIGATWYAWGQIAPPAPLQMGLPVMASGESIRLEVNNVPAWRAAIAWPGVFVGVAGIAMLVVAGRTRKAAMPLSWLALALIATGLLLQSHSGPLFFGVLACVYFYFFVRYAIQWQAEINRSQNLNSKSENEPTSPDGNTGPIVTATILLLSFLSIAFASNSQVLADEPDAKAEQVAANQTVAEASKFPSASSLIQNWTLSSREKRLTASAEIIMAGRPGDRFELLRSPAVLTKFTGEGLRLNVVELPGQAPVYVVTIPTDAPNGNVQAEVEDKSKDELPPLKQFKASYEYQLEAVQPIEGIPVLTGRAALEQVTLNYDDASWEVVCDTAARIESMPPELAGKGARAKILLGPVPSKIILRPQSRDLTTEKTQFFVEGAQLYTPGPGVIDGVHRFKIRTSQGRVQTLSLVIPAKLTVSAVDGPVTSWQFDADKSRLMLQIDRAVSSELSVTVQTQRSLDQLPASVELAPVRVEGAEGDVGLIALAFGTEAQPDNVKAVSLSQVNLGDFDASLLTNTQNTLHRVYRYGAEPGKLTLDVSPVAPEVRVTSKQVVSFGDERIVLGINFLAEITRTGLFQLSFPLPAGLEVESLTGDALHHWSELTNNGQRQIVMHLKGKTTGTQKFSLSLAAATPTDVTEWAVPRFELNEATRQAGDLVIQPITGIRLRTMARQNVSETDPRSLGAPGQGALAFRLLQRDWSLQVGVEKLAPWVTGQVLHEVTLREGQTRSIVLAEINVQNAAIRTLSIKLPDMGADEAKTVHANGESISDFVRSAADSNVWEIQFKRRVIGAVKFQIEFERRGQRAGDSETLAQVELPEARQLNYYFAVRAGGRLEIEPGTLTQGWQRNDWSTIPQTLREAGNRNAPALALRAMAPTTPLSLKVIRHSLADALKLRVASGTLTTILSPTGDQLTAVDLNMDVIQRSSLSVQLPAEGELFSIFVNGESVHSIRQTGNSNTWQFYILPGMDDRTAQVRFVYSLKGSLLRKLKLVSPQLNVPLENIQWNVIAPSGYEMIDNDGNLELVSQSTTGQYDRQAYLSILKNKRQDQAQQAAKLLEQANQLLQTGEQSKAQWAFNNVANRYALDAASNEDARVQLENLQTQQAIVGLNTRRQRLFLDRDRDGEETAGSEQLRQAAAVNPILQQEQMNYRPQELSQLLAGNSKEDNANLQQIAGRLVQHQRTTEPAPQAIVISLPEDGNVYTFRRSVQVAENAPLELELEFHSEYKLRAWQWAMLVAMVGVLISGMAVAMGKASRLV